MSTEASAKPTEATEHKLSVNRGGCVWDFTAQNASGEVWFHVFAGPVSGGLHLTLAQARELAEAIEAAADDLQSQMEREGDFAGEPRFDALAQQQVTHGPWDEPA